MLLRASADRSIFIGRGMRYEVISRPLNIVFPKIISLDTEYTDLNLRKAEPLSVSIGVSPDLTYIIRDYRCLPRFMEDAEIIFTWNGVVDSYIIGKLGYIFPRDKMIDAMLLEHLIDERLDHGLGDYALREEKDGYKKEFWSKYSSFSEAPEEEANQYEMRDGIYTYRAGVKYLNLLRDRMDLIQHVHRLQWALFDTETEGVCVDVPLIEKTKHEMSSQISGFLPKLRDKFGGSCSILELRKWKNELDKRKTDRGRSGVRRPDFQWSSDAQLRDLVYGVLNCPVIETTKTGQGKTDYETLRLLSKHNPDVGLIADYKETKAVYSTFVEGFLERVENGRIYPHFNPNGTHTGRLSSSNPNFQNMPQEGVIRNFILPDSGCLIVGADFKSLEAGVEGNLTEDPQLLKIILEGADKHDITAQAVGMSRKDAKTLNYLCQYGGGEWKIMKTFGVSAATAKEIYEKYWNAYSGVRKYKESVFKTLAETGEVTNVFGRTRHFNPPQNEFEKAKQERQAYSHMVQGPGGEMNNMATYLVADYFKANSLGRMLYPVHDELVCSAKENRVEEAKENIVRIMEITNQRLGFKYPIKAQAYGGFKCWQKT